MRLFRLLNNAHMAKIVQCSKSFSWGEEERIGEEWSIWEGGGEEGGVEEEKEWKIFFLTSFLNIFVVFVR